MRRNDYPTVVPAQAGTVESDLIQREALCRGPAACTTPVLLIEQQQVATRRQAAGEAVDNVPAQQVIDGVATADPYDDCIDL